MPAYALPKADLPKKPARRGATLIASGDHRLIANTTCWPAQKRLEADAREAFAALGWSLDRAGGDDYGEGHGFIDSQSRGRDIFAQIHPDAPLVVAEAVWQYSQHVLAGLSRHRGPIVLVANWSGQWPGLVGVLNLRGSLTKAGIDYSILWGEDFSDASFREKLGQWVHRGRIKHDLSHVQRLDADDLPKRERRLGEALAADLRRRPAIIGVFDEGCMGMYNAIIPDRLLHECGVFKERLSQSQLFAAMQGVSDEDAGGVRRWLDDKGMRFLTGPDPATDLTDSQIREQCRMYIAAARFAERYGMDAIGIQYQLGLNDLCAASDLAEGLLNCSDRPPVHAIEGSSAGRGIAHGRPITHFNEVDECAGLDGLMTQRVWSAMGLEGDNTLHDLRWADPWQDIEGSATYVWVFEISGAVPPSHLDGGYRGATGERQPAMYFHKGGSTIKGMSRPGEVVWSRIFVDRDKKGQERLSMDLGRCAAIALPPEEMDRRWRSTTPQWPIMNAVLYGIGRDQMMARHQSNHIQVAYAPDPKTADRALAAKAAMAHALGIRVSLCGDSADGRPLGEALDRL